MKLSEWRVPVNSETGLGFILGDAMRYFLLMTAEKYVKPADTKEALAMSIAKWEILQLASSEGIRIEERGIITCGLCILFYNGRCTGCPIAEVTGQEVCDGTTYHQFTLAQDEHRFDDAARHAESMLNLLKEIWEKDYQDPVPSFEVPSLYGLEV